MGSITENNPNLSPIYTISYTSHGVPFRYVTVYSNRDGIDTAANPVNSGVHYKIVALDYVCWTLLFFVLLGIPFYLKKRRQQSQLESRHRHTTLPPH